MTDHDQRVPRPAPSAEGESTGPAPAPPVRHGVGSVLVDRYRLTQRLGRGGMGTVWQAEHVTLGQPVAIKLVDPRLADHPRTRARFMREALALAQLRCPHVVQIFDYGVDAGTPYIVMEYLHGESLADRLRRVGRLSPASTATILGQIGQATSRAHAAGIVHRDLKPDNVFIVADDDGEHCKVLDFGIAKRLPTAMPISTEDRTQSGTILGTPHYMSPEQASQPQTVGTQSDLWAMAVIAYECLVAERPFDGRTLPALAVKLLAEPPPVPSEHANVPPGFDAWFARATQRDPQRRFSSAKELTAELARALSAAREPRPKVLASLTFSSHPRGGRWILILPAMVAAGAAGWTALPRDNTPVSDRPSSSAPRIPAEEGPLRDPSPTPAATPSPPLPLERASLPERIELHLEGPSGAEVYRGDVWLGRIPTTIALPRGTEPVLLRVASARFQERSVRIIPNADQRRSVRMKPRRATAPAASRSAKSSSAPADRAEIDDLEF